MSAQGDLEWAIRNIKDAEALVARPKDFGAQGRNRTSDTVIFSHVLYQLSYLGARIGRRAPTVRQAVF